MKQALSRFTHPTDQLNKKNPTVVQANEALKKELSEENKKAFRIYFKTFIKKKYGRDAYYIRIDDMEMIKND